MTDNTTTDPRITDDTRAVNPGLTDDEISMLLDYEASRYDDGSGA